MGFLNLARITPGIKFKIFALVLKWVWVNLVRVMGLRFRGFMFVG